ncbi:Activating molecule in BECN1-regulated autophagy protein 1 [Frankliniella fusca]|uniref:Activating molecule in BECN1-regulated autophagy protein 1 n=1 Tax=Frankliniella fusca TaxID=407009 RepID=A0AAE1LNU5_9NEOP|nr:Activating molecule in BECN1-regulated autophagy protein 1 [Frankliniella fusca]
MEDYTPRPERATQEKMSPQYKELVHNRNIPHAVVMREYGFSRCPSHLSSEFRIAAEEQLIKKKKKEMKCELPDFTRSTYLMVFSPDGKKMASSHGNHNVYITDVKTGKNLNTLTGHPRTPWCIAFHPSSNQILASGCLGGQVRVWDLHGGSEVWTVEGQTSIASLAFHPSDRLLVIASYNEIYFWDWSQPEPFARCCTLNEKEKIRYVAFDHSGSKLVTGIEIPKPIVSQWDRVGSGGQVNRTTGPGSPRSSVQRPFGPRYNEQLRQLLLRSAQNELNISTSRRLEHNERRNLSNAATAVGSTSLRNDVNPVNSSEDRVNTHSSSQVSGRSVDLLPESFQERRDFYQRTPVPGWNLDAVQFGFGGERLNSTRPTVIRNLASQSSFHNSPAGSTTHRSSFRDILSNSLHSEHSSDSSASEQERRDENRSFLNLGHTPGISSLFRNGATPSTSFSRVSGLRNRTSSRILRQSSPSYIDSDITNQFNHPSEEIRRTLYTLSEHIDEMQHCSVCLPRMTSSRLSHIQQLWAELRDQIRSLQSSILENTNLASNAWHRSSFEVITEMLSHLTHGGEDSPSVRTSESSSNSSSRQTSQVNPRFTSSNSWTSSVASRRQIPSTQIRSSTLFSRGETSSASSSQPVPTANASSSNIRDTSTPLNSRSPTRSNISRSLIRPNQTRRLLYLKCQNGHGRRLGSTAGLLRAQRTAPLRLTQPPRLQNGEQTSEQSPSSSGTEALGCDRSDTAQSEEQRGYSDLESDLSLREEESTAGENEIQLSSNASSSSNLSTITNPSSTHGHQLQKYRFFLGRRRNVTSRIFRSSSIRGAHRPSRTTPPRFFGGRRSLLEVSVAHGASQPQAQPPRNIRASSQSSVRTSDNMLMRIFRSLRRAATLSGRSDRQSLQQDRSSPADDGTPSRQSPHHNQLLASNTSSELQEQSGLSSGPSQRPTSTDVHQQHENSSPGLRLWTQYSGPDGDVLHIRHPHLERVDPSVQERLLRIRSSGTMNIVQDGVMTEELARNLLRLHLHQQHQELQLRQHQARLRVRFHHQSTLRSSDQAQRDGSRRHARCTLCGGSIFISSHLLVRVGTSTQDPQPAHTVSNDPPVWQRWLATSPSSQPPAPTPPPPPPPPPPPLPAQFASSPPSSSSSFWQREAQESSHSPERTNSPPIPSLQHGQIVEMPTVQEPLPDSPHPAHPPLQPPLVRSNVFFEEVNDNLIIHSSPPQPSPLTDTAAVSSTSVLSAPLQQINPRPDSMRSSSGVISPPQLILGFSPLPPLLTPPSPPSPTLLSSSSPTSPPLPPPPPPPLVSSPMVSQVSTQTTPRYFEGISLNGPTRLSSQRIDYTGSASLFWQVPASHHRHHISPLGSPGRPRGTQLNQRQQSSMFNPSASSLPVPSAVPYNPEVLNTSQNSVVENLPTDIPSTSSGIRAGNGGQEVNKPLIPQVRGDSSSSDSETEGLVAHLQNRKRIRHQFSKRNGEQETKAHSSCLKSVDSDDSHSCTNDCEPSTSSNSLLTSCGSSNRNPSLKRKGVDSSEQCGTSTVKTTVESSGTSCSNLEGLERGEAVRGTSKRSKGSSSKIGERKNSCQTNVQGEATSSSPNNQNLEREPLNSGPEGSPLHQLPEPTFTRQLEAITGRLDHLMFLQRNALDPSQRNRNGLSPDNSPLRNAGDPSNSSQEQNGSSDAINITSRLLTRLTESLSRQIQMVQQVRGRQGNCTEHQESPSRSGASVQSNFTMINNTRRRGQELLSLMADSLSTFSSHNGLPDDFRSNPTFDHVQTISAAFWLLQGLYILLHLALELTDLLLTHFVSSYEPSDPEEGSPLPQPCVCLNAGATSSSTLFTRLPNASSDVWNRSTSPVGSSNPRPLGSVMMNSAYDSHRFSTRIPRPPMSNSSHRAQPNTNEATNVSSFSAVRRPRLVNLHNVFTSTRPHIRSPPVLESYLRSRRNLQNESPAVVQIPVMPVPSYTPQVNNESSSEGWHHPSTYAVVHPIASTGAIRRNASQAPRTSFAQYFQQSENIIPPAGHIRPGFMRLRSRLLHPPLLRQQERPSPSSDAETSAQQPLFFHYDYTRNIGHFVREPNFTTEEHRIHRIQLWDFSKGDIPDISDGDENVVVAECKIHNDASVDISADGHLLVALLPAPRPTANPYLPTSPPGQTIGVYSLVWDSLGQLLYTTNLDQPAVSVALSPSAAYLLVGLATRRAMLPMPSDQNALAQIFRLEGAKPGRPIGARGRLNFTRNIEAQNDNVSVGINCIRWAPVSGQGIVYGTNTGSLVMLH